MVNESQESDKAQISMVGFVLGNTLSDNGSVTRGLCKVDKNGLLTDIVETYNIFKTETGAVVRTEEGETEVDAKSLVSMNMWGLQPQFFEILEEGFEKFLTENADRYQKAEYLLPTIVGGLLRAGNADITVLKSNDQWFGVTYREDKPYVVASIRGLVDAGVYPEKLFEEK